MTTTAPQTLVELLTDVQDFIALVPRPDKNEVYAELELAQKVRMLGTHFQQVLAEPALWALFVYANGHNWCILAYLEQHLVGSHLLVCTHAFKQDEQDQKYISRRELDKALRLYKSSR